VFLINGWDTASLKHLLQPQNRTKSRNTVEYNNFWFMQHLNKTCVTICCIDAWVHYHHLHGLGHAWPVPSFWRVCWSRHLNCGRPLFRLLSGMYVKMFSGICLSPIRRTWCISPVFVL
jgi:hypothetical protein